MHIYHYCLELRLTLKSGNHEMLDKQYRHGMVSSSCKITTDKDYIELLNSLSSKYGVKATDLLIMSLSYHGEVSE